MSSLDAAAAEAEDGDADADADGDADECEGEGEDTDDDDVAFDARDGRSRALNLARALARASDATRERAESYGAKAALTRALAKASRDGDEEAMCAIASALGRFGETTKEREGVELKSVAGSQVGATNAGRRAGVFNVNLRSKVIRVVESAWEDAGLAWRVWGASQILGRVVDAAPELARGKRCLEIGAGCGFVALVAASVGAARVVISDGAPGALRAIRQSIAALEPDASARATAAFLDFRDDEDVLDGIVSIEEARSGVARHWVHNCKPDARVEMTDNRVPADDVFDVVLATDVIYAEEHASPLAACFARRLAPGGVGYAMNACRHGGLMTSFVHALVKRGMSVQISALDRFEGEDLAEYQGGHLHRALPEQTELWWSESAAKLATFDECVVTNCVTLLTYDAFAKENLMSTLEGRFVLIKMSPT